MEIVSRFLPISRQSFFLFGPRGTGKTTWLRQQFPDALFVDLLKEDVFRSMSARPERLKELVLGAPDKAVVVVDEVQRVPEVLNVVHELIERLSDVLFVLTGSSARNLRRGGVDLLAGRALNRSLHPFMAAEYAAFELDRALELGLVPLVVAAEEPAEALKAYVSLYLDQDVRVEGWVRNVGRFTRFLEAVSFSHAQVLNIANVARECEVERKTVSGYVEILEDLLLAFRLPVFQRRARRQLTTHPKFFLFDVGVFRSLRPQGPLDRPEEVSGAALEGLVAQHLRAWAAYSPSTYNLYYWRTRSGVEVDFILYGADGFWAIEVKNGRHVRRSDLRSLRAFRSDFPECRALFLYRGEDRLLIDDILCLPVASFLRALKPSKTLSVDQRA